MSIHKEPSPLAGQAVKIKSDALHLGGQEYRVEDWWDRVGGDSWMNGTGIPACHQYAARGGMSSVPCDDEVLYGKIGALGHLVHVSEIEQPQEESHGTR